MSLFDSFAKSKNNKINDDISDYEYFFAAMEFWDDYAGRFSNPLQAIKLLSKTILLNPKIETAYHFRGFAYSQLNKFDLAIED